MTDLVGYELEVKRATATSGKYLARQYDPKWHKITKYHLADFVGGSKISASVRWQLQILNFSVNLQNGNCISHCVPQLAPFTTPPPPLGFGHQWLTKSSFKFFQAMEGGGSYPHLFIHNDPFFHNKTSLSYFVNVTKRWKWMSLKWKTIHETDESKFSFSEIGFTFNLAWGIKKI